MPVSLHSVGWDWWLGAVSLLCRAGGWGCSGVQAELRMSGLESCVFSSCVLHNLLLLLFLSQIGQCSSLIAGIILEQTARF